MITEANGHASASPDHLRAAARAVGLAVRLSLDDAYYNSLRVIERIIAMLRWRSQQEGQQ
jgi:hypothetical protein